jgi:hypothetical protein
MSGVRACDVTSSREGQRPNPYRYTAGIIRSFWAWEYLRRDPHYHAAYDNFRDVPAHAEAENWSLVRFEDPNFDGRVADVFWQRQVCRHVLPLTASTRYGRSEGHHFSLTGLHCRVAIERAADRCHILFAENGRALQVEISGDANFEDRILLTPALPPPGLRAARLLAIRRLADLMTHGHLRPSLYPPERRAARLARVLQALDGSLAGLSQRDIAIALFGEARVDRDWHHPHNYLRDHVRRAIIYGRELMEGGYRKLLR